jgi:nucleoside-diphosphate-sugar epimerase
VNSPVLVTGATGFVGSHLVDRLLECGAAVRCLARRTSSLQYLDTSRVELCYGDAPEGLERAIQGVDVVFHVAGVTKALDSRDYYRGNVGLTEDLLRACERSTAPPARLVVVSSLAAAGPSPGGSPLGEDAQPHPLTHYGKSKLAAELAVRASRFGASSVILRPAVVYGPRDTDVLQVFRSVSKGRMFKIGRGPSYFSYIYVKDLADALLAAASSPTASGRTYFLANPQPVSWDEFGAEAAAILGRKLRSVAAPAAVAYLAGWCAELASRFRGAPGILSREKVREARCRYWICNTSRAREELGFAPQRSLEQGMRETLAWYKDTKWVS